MNTYNIKNENDCRKFLIKKEKDIFGAIIYPPAATFILENWNYNNRSIRKSVAMKYAEYNKNSSQKEGDSMLMFSPTGHLLNGQHRLEATIISNLPLRCEVKVGIKEEDADLVDKQIKRTDGATYILTTNPNATERGFSIAKNYITYVGFGGKAPGNTTPSFEDEKECYEKDEETFEDVAKLTGILGEYRRMPFVVALTLHWRKNPKKAEQMYEKLKETPCQDRKLAFLKQYLVGNKGQGKNYQDRYEEFLRCNKDMAEYMNRKNNEPKINKEVSLW